jgi:murein L,D-transpeptidase YcbB/YkuD
MLVRISIVILFLFATQPVFGTPMSPQAVAIRAHVEQIRAGNDLTIAGQTISSVLVLPSLYERRDYSPVWDNPQAERQLIETLEHVDSDGLISKDYHLPVILKLQANNPVRDPATVASLDILKTDALIRLGYHLLAGKVDAEGLDANWNMTTTIGDLDTILSLAGAIESARIPQLIEQLRPDHSYYAFLQQGLARYRTIRDQGGWPSVTPGPVLKLGMTDTRVPVIRKRLSVTGELTAADTVSESYEETLTGAVKRFQQHHGLTADGVIGGYECASAGAHRSDQGQPGTCPLGFARPAGRRGNYRYRRFRSQLSARWQDHLVNTCPSWQTLPQDTSIQRPDSLP